MEACCYHRRRINSTKTNGIEKRNKILVIDLSSITNFLWSRPLPKPYPPWFYHIRSSAFSWDAPAPPRNSRKTFARQWRKNGGHRFLDKVIKIDPSRERSCIFSDGATYHRLSWRCWWIIFPKHRCAEVSMFDHVCKISMLRLEHCFPNVYYFCMESTRSHSSWCDKK
jgi:hypothetical protein